jgi:hypothetical protein
MQDVPDFAEAEFRDPASGACPCRAVQGVLYVFCTYLNPRLKIPNVHLVHPSLSPMSPVVHRLTEDWLPFLRLPRGIKEVVVTYPHGNEELEKGGLG